MECEIDSSQAILLHRKIINNKKFLKNIYKDFYGIFEKCVKKQKIIVELGSGAGFIKKVIPRAITSDVVQSSGIDRVFSAEKIPFKTHSIDAFLMLDTFHHIKNPQRALKEMQRCLKRRGKIVMIEPYNSFWGRFIYQNFHHEDFNIRSTWKIKGRGRLSNANGAIPWIIFVRDRKKFKKNFPSLKILKIKPHTPLKYLFSGGLSKPQLVPSFFYPLIKFIEKLLSPLNSFIGMFATIEVEKSK